MSESVLSAEAVDWALRVMDPDFAAWEDLTAWLESDPAHLDAYEAALAAGEVADQSLPDLTPGPVVEQRPDTRQGKPHRRWLAACGLAAAGLAGWLAWPSFSPQSEPYLIETIPGASRQLAIGGAEITMNGDTRIWLDHRNPRTVRIERGEALFEVRHDANHPFTVHVNGTELLDVGTRFDVTTDGRQTRIMVAEGAVVFEPRRGGPRIEAGKELIVAGEASSVEMRPTDARSVGGWRDGRFAYARTPIATVASDLSRRTGIRLVTDANVAAAPFSGVITFDGDQKAFVADLGPLLGVKVTPKQGHWLLSRTKSNG